MTGRVRQVIIRSDENLSPAEIENCLLEHRAVGGIAVGGLPSVKSGEIVAAFIRAAGAQVHAIMSPALAERGRGTPPAAC